MYIGGMDKKNVHVLMDGPLAVAIQRWADGHGVSFTSALSVLAARGLRDEGIFVPREEEEDHA